VNAADCAAQYAVAVYMTSALEQRAGAVFKAIDDMREVGVFLNPLREKERIAVEPLPDFEGEARHPDTLDIHVMDIDELKSLSSDRDEPCLPNPSVDEIMAFAGLEDVKSDDERSSLIQAMQKAALKRIEGVTEHKRRRHYGHAASPAFSRSSIDTLHQLDDSADSSSNRSS
jgi:hypothetical protein